jgi:hypothetical protein
MRQIWAMFVAISMSVLVTVEILYMNAPVLAIRAYYSLSM